MNSTIRRRYAAPIITIGRAIAQQLGGLGVGLVLAWPWVLLAVNRSWIFLNGSFVDGWIYFGFFHNLREYQNIYASANSSHQGFYYDDRLSWILPGYLVYQLFPPLIANYVLHIGLYYVVALALYATLALTIHRRAAVLAALLMGSYSYFLNAIGWDYVDGGGLAYCSLTLLLITLAAQRPRWPLWLGLAGMTAAALLFSNIFWVALAPCIGLYYLVINRQHSVKRVALGIAPLVAGALSLTAVIGLINLAFGGSPFFFASSLEFVSQSANASTNPWITTHSDWPITHPYLVWPLIMTLACGLWLATPHLRRRLSAYPQAPAFLALFLSMALSMLAIHLRRASPVLQVFFYASYLIFALFLAIAVMLAPLLATLSRARFAGLLSVTVLAALGAFAFRACGELPVAYPALPAIVLGLVWLVLLIGVPQQVWPYGVFILAFCVATPSAFGSYAIPYTTNSFCRLAPQTQPQPEDEYLAVLDGIEAIRQTVPEQRVFFWFNASEHVIYTELSSAYLYNWNQVSRDFPSVGGRDTSFPGSAPPSGTTVVVVSRSTSALAEADTALRQRNRTLRLLGQHDIRRGAIQFKLLVGVIEAVPEHVALDTTLDFTRPGDTDRFLLRGWGRPDTTGTWSEGPKAELHMLLDHAKHDVDMTVDVANTIGAFVPNPPDMSVNVSVNGVQLDTWHFNAERKWGQFSIVLPNNVLAISDTTRISFDIIDPHSPRDLGFNYNDIRSMGILVRSISFSQHNFWNAQSAVLGTPPPSGVRVGRIEKDGWAATVAQDPPGFLQYGPYTSTVSPGKRVATWKLMIDDTIADDLPIVRLEVVDATAGGALLASRIVTRKQWQTANQYQDFSVPFILDNHTPAHQLEFRVYWYKQASVHEQSVSIK